MYGHLKACCRPWIVHKAPDTVLSAWRRSIKRSNHGLLASSAVNDSFKNNIRLSASARAFFSTVHAPRVSSEPHLARARGCWRGEGVSCGWGRQSPANPHARESAPRGRRGWKQITPSVAVIAVVPARRVTSDMEPGQSDVLETQL